MTDKQHINGMYSVDETVKEKFEDFYPEMAKEIALMFGTQGLALINKVINQKVLDAKMEQDTINHKGFLDKQDEIVRLAKIEENKYHIEKILSAITKHSEVIDAARALAMNEVFKNRIKELEKEK